MPQEASEGGTFVSELPEAGRVWRAPNPLLPLEAAHPLSPPPPRFPTEIHSGLLEVISPSPHFYPDFSRLRESFGDPKERVRYLYPVPPAVCCCSVTVNVSLDPVWWAGWALPASVASLWQSTGGGIVSDLRPLPGPHRWRTKQNLDYCFLMMYAQSKGIYYVQVSWKLFSCPPQTLVDLVLAYSAHGHTWVRDPTSVLCQS